MQVVLFDIDGTLLTSGGAGYRAFDAIFLKHFQINNVTQGFSAGGMTDDLIIQHLFNTALGHLPTETELSKIRNDYLLAFRDYYAQTAQIRIMPLAVEIVTQLSQNPNVSLGLATGNYKQTAYEKIKRLKIDQHFAYGGFGCDHVSREVLTAKALERAIEHIETMPTEVYVVGDTTRDIECAKHIGAKVIAVATGAHSWETLQSLKPDYLIRDFSEFPDFLLRRGAS